MFPIDLPHDLPPIRRIDHHSDLIPEAPLPNREAYKCNPIKTKKLQRQLDELIATGLVRECMSRPCSVPVLLVPKKEGTYRMCVDSTTINNITIKYRYSITHLDNLLDELYSASIFPRLIYGVIITEFE